MSRKVSPVFYQPSVFNICHSPVCALSFCLCREEETGLARENLTPFRWMGRVRYDCIWLSYACSLGCKKFFGPRLSSWRLILPKGEFAQPGNTTSSHRSNSHLGIPYAVKEQSSLKLGSPPLWVFWSVFAVNVLRCWWEETFCMVP